MIAIPDTAGDIDGPWLERALAPRYPGVSVSGVEIIDRTEMTNSHARLAVTYRDDVGAPSSMGCGTLPPSDRGRGKHALKLATVELIFLFLAAAAHVEDDAT